jgi:hypothetical protein
MSGILLTASKVTSITTKTKFVLDKTNATNKKNGSKRRLGLRRTRAWNNDDHENVYNTDMNNNNMNDYNNDINDESSDDGDMFEGDDYLQASESLKQKHNKVFVDNKHVLPALLFPVSEPLIPGQRKVLHLYEPRFVSLLNDSVQKHGGLIAFVHYSQIPTKNNKQERRRSSNEREEKLEVFGNSDSEDSDSEDEFDTFNRRNKLNSAINDDDDDDEENEENTQSVQLNAACTLGRIVQYEPIKMISSDDFDIVDGSGFGETYRVLVVGESRMMVEDVNETNTGYVSGTFSLVNSPNSKFAVQPTDYERKEIENLANDVELLMNYVVEFSDKLLEVSGVTREMLFDKVVHKAETNRNYPTEIHRKFAIEEAKMERWAKTVARTDCLKESMKWVEEDGVFFDAKVELKNLAKMKLEINGLSLDDAILSRLRRSAALTMKMQEEETSMNQNVRRTKTTKLSSSKTTTSMVRAERLSFAAFQEVPFASETEGDKLIARRAAAMASSRGLLDRLRLAKMALEEQLGGLRAKLALEKSLRAVLNKNDVEENLKEVEDEDEDTENGGVNDEDDGTNKPKQ